MPEPVHIAAIDAGSNAVRLSVARAYSALDIEPLQTERYPLRLGEGVFVRPRFSEDVFKKAAKAFRHLREVMDDFGVTRYRAVATSATREARNRDAFVRAIKRKSGIALEVINPAEESRLGREAVFAALGPEAVPRCIVDLGGGSLEISILRNHTVEQGAQLPVGTVRLLTTLDLPEEIRAVECEQVRKYVRALLESKLVPRPNVSGGIAVALGGNNARVFAVPGVGVREGLLQEMARETFSRKEPHRYNAAARQLLVGARNFARRLEYDQRHGEHVRELSLQLFDQLQPVHGLPPQSRVLLEAGALLHDTGHRISHRGHHKHGEYLALSGDIPGLEGRERAIVAGLVRYHNRKAEPAGHHPAYSSLDDADKPLLRRLAAILRIAEGLDHSHRQRIVKIHASFQRGAVALEVQASGDAAEDLRDAGRSAEWLEKELHVKVYFRQAPGILNRIRQLLRPSSSLRDS